MSKHHLSPSDTELVISSMADCSVSHEERAWRLTALAGSAKPSCSLCAESLADLREKFAANAGSRPPGESAVSALVQDHVALFWHLVDVHAFNRVKRFRGRVKAFERGELVLMFEWQEGPSYHEMENAIRRSPLGSHVRVVLHRSPSATVWAEAFQTLERHFGIELPTRVVETRPGRYDLRWDEWSEVRIAGQSLEAWALHVVNGTAPLPNPTASDAEAACRSDSAVVRNMGLMLMGHSALAL